MSFQLTIDYKQLVPALLKTGAELTGVSTLNAIAELWGALDVKKPAEPPQTPEEQAALLIKRALAEASIRTLDWAGAADLHPDTKVSAKAKIAGLQTAQVPLQPDDFGDLRQLPALLAYRPFFAKVGKALKISGKTEDDLLARLSDEFVIAVDAEQRKERQLYASLESFLAPTVGDAAARRVRNWERYRRELIGDVRKPLLNFPIDDKDAVGLEQVYVPLRAWDVRNWTDEEGEAELRRVVVWLWEAVGDWLANADKTDPFRLISGEMGCGKSSFCKMLAADLARKKRPVLIVPLHRLRGFSGGVRDTIGEFARQDYLLGHDPLSDDALKDYGPDRPLLIIFDGLDELSTGGGAVERKTSAFVADARAIIGTLNGGGRKVMALFAGRPLAAAEFNGLGAPGQRLHVLRYQYNPYDGVAADKMGAGRTDAGRSDGLDEWGRKPMIVPDNKDDPLRTDQAPLWWAKFRAAAPGTERMFPADLAETAAMQSLLAQPLLNYLVAVVPDGDKATSINQLYDRLFHDLFERETATGQRYAGQEPKSDVLLTLCPGDNAACHRRFRVILEHVAMAAWHGGDRTVAKTEIGGFMKAVVRDDLLKDIETVGEGLKTVLNSFFVHGAHVPDHYDFTHKSFREYLTACYLRGLMREIGENFGNRVPGLTYDVAWAAERWLIATGATGWDRDLQTFFEGEIRLWHATDRASLLKAKDALRATFGHGLVHGMPMPAQATGPLDVLERTANAELGFMVALEACRDVIKAAIAGNEGDPERRRALWTEHAPDWHCFPADLPPDSPAILPRLLARLRARKGHREDMLLWYASALLDGARTQAAAQFFVDELGNLLAHQPLDLSNSPLAETDLSAANLGGANLGGANLENADLENANLEGAKLERAKLGGANLESANLKRASLTGANLEHAYLGGANLGGANLGGANLGGANLGGANLGGANLRGANLTGANLERASLTGANLEHAYLGGANLGGANLGGANLDGAFTEGAMGLPKKRSPRPRKPPAADSADAT